MWKRIIRLNRMALVAVVLICAISVSGCQSAGTGSGIGSVAMDQVTGAASNEAADEADEAAGGYTDGGLNGSADRQERDGTLLITATDLHYLSPQLTDYGEAFTDMMAKGDGKVTEYAPQLMDAFLAEVLDAKPDALVLSGDLAFNGEKQSHVELAEKLSAVSAQGIPVAVIPGNHDIRYPLSYRYEGGEVYRTANVSSEEFEEIYHDFGFAQALSRDEHSLSYVFPLSDQVRLLLLDVNAVEKPGSIPEETLEWAKTQLTAAKEAGVTVIGVTHQNTMVHHDMFIRGYRIGNYNKIIQLFADYDVPLNLSGHIHIQNITRDTNFNEASTGSLSVWPNLYAVVEVTDQGDISYQTKQTNVGGWAKTNKKAAAEMPELLEFETLAASHFEACTNGKILDELEYLEVTDTQREEMARFVAEANRLYFSGRLREQKETLQEQEAWKLLEEKGDWTFLKEYLDICMDGSAKPDNELFIPGEAGVK